MREVSVGLFILLKHFNPVRSQLGMVYNYACRVFDDLVGLFGRVLVAVDGSEFSRRAADVAVRLCKSLGAELLVLHVVQQPPYLFAAAGVPPTALKQFFDDARAEGWRYVEEVLGKASDEGVRARGEVLERAPSVVEAITTFAANEKVDLIVTGTRGLSGFKKVVLGSVASGVVEHAHCSVLVVK
jgi:nucleotide-binding universal stress UspA family protein